MFSTGKIGGHDRDFGGQQRFWRVVVPSKLPHLCQRPLKNRKSHYFCYGRVHPYFQLCSPGPLSKVRLRRDNIDGKCPMYIQRSEPTVRSTRLAV